MSKENEQFVVKREDISLIGLILRGDYKNTDKVFLETKWRMVCLQKSNGNCPHSDIDLPVCRDCRFAQHTAKQILISCKRSNPNYEFNLEKENATGSFIAVFRIIGMDNNFRHPKPLKKVEFSVDGNYRIQGDYPGYVSCKIFPYESEDQSHGQMKYQNLPDERSWRLRGRKRS